MEQENINYLRSSYAADRQAERGFVHYEFADGTGATTAHPYVDGPPVYAEHGGEEPEILKYSEKLESMEPQLASSHGGVVKVTISAFRVPIRDASIRTAVRSDLIAEMESTKG